MAVPKKKNQNHSIPAFKIIIISSSIVIYKITNVLFLYNFFFWEIHTCISKCNSLNITSVLASLENHHHHQYFHCLFVVYCCMYLCCMVACCMFVTTLSFLYIFWLMWRCFLCWLVFGPGFWCWWGWVWEYEMMMNETRSSFVAFFVKVCTQLDILIFKDFLEENQFIIFFKVQYQEKKV